ncbi:MAG: carbon storage regulator [Planctomycetaceae bacterium]
MLVLSRKKGEAIQIAENIVVTIADVRGGRVRLSIDAPRSVPVYRQEVLERRGPNDDAAMLLSGGGTCQH